MALRNPISGGIWNPISLAGSYVATGAPYLTPSYRKDSSGIVYLRGNASYVSGGITTILTLPSGFRPAGSCRFIVPVLDSSGVANLAWFDMTSSGNFNYVNGNASTITFDQIYFATY